MPFYRIYAFDRGGHHRWDCALGCTDDLAAMNNAIRLLGSGVYGEVWHDTRNVGGVIGQAADDIGISTNLINRRRGAHLRVVTVDGLVKAD